MWIIELLRSKAFWICVSLALLVAGGWYVKGVFDERERLEKENGELRAAQQLGRDLQRAADQSESAWLALLRKQKEEADANQSLLDQQLDAANHSLRACVLDAGTLRVLNRKQKPSPSSAPSGLGSGAPGVEAPPVSCEDLARNYSENRSIYDITAEQVRQLRAFYAEVRRKYCAQTGAC